MAISFKLKDEAVAGDNIFSEKILDIELNSIADVVCLVQDIETGEEIARSASNEKGVVMFMLNEGKYNMICEKPGYKFQNPNEIEVL